MRLRLLKKFVMFGHDVVSVRGTKLIQRFQSGNFDVKDTLRSGRLITGKVEIMEKVEQDQHISSHDIDKELNINHKIVLNHLE